MRTQEQVVGPPTPRSRPLVLALVVAGRPKQWTKNVLVFAAPGAAGLLDRLGTLGEALAAFACFCLVSSGTYLLNDAADIDQDQRHPTKRYRPVAAGEVGLPMAWATGVLLMVAGVAAGFALRWQLGVVLVGYAALTTTYSVWLKHIAVVDLTAVAAGFVLRTIAGAAATSVPISDWFFIVASFGSLLMVAGKRHAESVAMGDQAGSVRRCLDDYSPSYLAYLRSVSSGVVLVAYCLWAFEKAELVGSPTPWFQLSILPFVSAILRYAQLVDAGFGGAPEDLVFTDRVLLLLGAAWAVLFALGVYLG